ncbi:MAG: hypothetical protein EZS28_029280, partial [Streblomastix strix]
EENTAQEKQKSGLEDVALTSVSAVTFSCAFLGPDLEMIRCSFDNCSSQSAKYGYLNSSHLDDKDKQEYKRIPIAGAVAFNLFNVPDTCSVNGISVDEEVLTMFCLIKSSNFSNNTGPEAGAMLLAGSSYEITMVKCLFDRNSAIGLGDQASGDINNKVITIDLPLSSRYFQGNDLYLLPNPCNYSDEGNETIDKNNFTDGYKTSIFSSTSSSQTPKIGHSWQINGDFNYDTWLIQAKASTDDQQILNNRTFVYVNWEKGNDQTGTGDKDDGSQVKTLTRALELVDWTVESKIYLGPYHIKDKQLFIRGFNTILLGLSDSELALERTKHQISQSSKNRNKRQNIIRNEQCSNDDTTQSCYEIGRSRMSPRSMQDVKNCNLGLISSKDYQMEVEDYFIQVRTGGLVIQNIDLIQVPRVSQNSHLIMCEKRSKMIIKNCAFSQLIQADNTIQYPDEIKDYQKNLTNDILEEFTTWPIYRSCYIMMDDSLLILQDVKFQRGTFTDTSAVQLDTISDTYYCKLTNVFFFGITVKPSRRVNESVISHCQECQEFNKTAGTSEVGYCDKQPPSSDLPKPFPNRCPNPCSSKCYNPSRDESRDQIEDQDQCSTNDPRLSHPNDTYDYQI